MKKYLTFSNIIFVIGIVILLYKPSRSWVIRQISFSPSVKEVAESERLTDYNFYLKGLNTKDVDFNKLKGKVVFLNYWATWCPPCVAEFPSIQKLYNDYKNNVVFLLVTNDNWQNVNKFYKENGYDLPVYNFASNLPAVLNKSNSIPTTHVIDKKGFIRVYKTGSADWNTKKFRKKINEFIKE